MKSPVLVRVVVLPLVMVVSWRAPGSWADETIFDTAAHFGNWPSVATSAYQNRPAYGVQGREYERVGKRLRSMGPYVRYGGRSGNRITTVFITFPTREIGDTEFAEFKLLSELENLRLDALRVTDRSVLPLDGLPRLMRLSVSYARITDATLEHISKLRQLEVLEIPHTLVTDRGLEFLRSLPRLRSLNLAGTSIGARGLRALAHIPQLRELNVAETALTDDTVQLLPKTLTWLDASRTQLGDTGVSYLVASNHLHALMLNDTQITDKSISSFGKMHALNDLWLAGDKISFSAVSDLRALRLLRFLEVRRTLISAKQAHDLVDMMPNTFVGSDVTYRDRERLVRFIVGCCPHIDPAALVNGDGKPYQRKDGTYPGTKGTSPKRSADAAALKFPNQSQFAHYSDRVVYNVRTVSDLMGDATETPFGDAGHVYYDVKYSLGDRVAHCSTQDTLPSVAAIGTSWHELLGLDWDVRTRASAERDDAPKGHASLVKLHQRLVMRIIAGSFSFVNEVIPPGYEIVSEEKGRGKGP